MRDQANSTPEGAIDVVRQRCPTARVSTVLPLALIEELDRARGFVSRSTYLAQVMDAAMTREAPRPPDTAAGADLIDSMADRRYRQHVRSLELAEGRESSR